MKTTLTITTPYSLGDKVWIIKDGVPTEIEISGYHVWVEKGQSAKMLFGYDGGACSAWDKDVCATRHEALCRLNTQVSVTIEEQQ